MTQIKDLDCTSFGWRIVTQNDSLLAVGLRSRVLFPMLHDVGKCEAVVVVCCPKQKVFGVEIDQSVEQHLRRMGTQLLGFPQVLLLDPRDVVSKLVDGKFEVFDDFVQGRRKRLVILIRKDVVDASVFEQILLNAVGQVEDGVCRVSVAVGLLDLLDEHAQRVIQFISS